MKSVDTENFGLSKRLARADGVQLAYHQQKGQGVTLIFLPGYGSDMSGSKAIALHQWAKANGQNFIRFDYSGCGESDGQFDTCTLDQWRDDALFIIDQLTHGPIVLVGSSMGGWLMLLVALTRSDRVVGIVGIAAAADFSDWGFTQQEKLEILGKGRLERFSQYGPEPTVTTRTFWQSAENNRLLHSEIAISCPVRLLHGIKDTDVPWHHSPHLGARIRSDDVQTILVKDGDHRLSRENDIALLLRTVKNLLEQL